MLTMAYEPSKNVKVYSNNEYIKLNYDWSSKGQYKSYSYTVGKLNGKTYFVIYEPKTLNYLFFNNTNEMMNYIDFAQKK